MAIDKVCIYLSGRTPSLGHAEINPYVMHIFVGSYSIHMVPILYYVIVQLLAMPLCVFLGSFTKYYTLQGT